MNKKGMLFVVSGPSGCGKGTVLGEILKDDRFYYSVSATTRSPREGERDGVNYHFLTREKFEELIGNGEMLEYAEYCGNYYGTPLTYIDKKLSEGKHVILEIEVQGAMNVRKLRDDAVLIFILPPSLKELRRRLEKRGTESAEVVEKRISAASEEIRTADKYDYIMINGELEKAVEDFRSIITAAEMYSGNNKYLIDEVLNDA
ncbi:MAG: guanylate kinase [Oscillospiraceae bacterium]|nr:guanylate kinase [Oscillospiraceae bacterium]